jgi:MFS family permease
MRILTRRFLDYVGHGVNDIYWFVLPVILPFLLDRFSIPYSTAGLILSSYLFVIAVGHYVFGRLSDLKPHGLIIGAGFYLTSVAFIITAFIPNLPLFVLGLLIAAVGVSTFHPVAYAGIDTSTIEHRGRTFGNFEMWGNAALFAMYLLSGLLLRKIGWRGVLVAVGLPGMIVGFFFLRQRFTEQENPSPTLSSPASASIPVAAFVSFLLSVMLRVISTIGLMNFVPTYLVKSLGLNPERAALFAGLSFAGGLISAPLLGRAADRVGPFPVLITVTAVLAPVIFLFGLSTTQWLAPVFIALIGVAAAGCGPSQNMILSDLGSKLGSGKIFGLVTAAVALANSFSPALFGALADRFGLETTVRLTAIPIVLSVVILLFLSRLEAVRRAFSSKAVV